MMSGTRLQPSLAPVLEILYPVSYHNVPSDLQVSTVPKACRGSQNSLLPVIILRSDRLGLIVYSCSHQTDAWKHTHTVCMCGACVTLYCLCFSRALPPSSPPPQSGRTSLLEVLSVDPVSLTGICSEARVGFALHTLGFPVLYPTFGPCLGWEGIGVIGNGPEVLTHALAHSFTPERRRRHAPQSPYTK